MSLTIDSIWNIYPKPKPAKPKPENAKKIYTDEECIAVLELAKKIGATAACKELGFKKGSFYSISKRLERNGVAWNK